MIDIMNGIGRMKFFRVVTLNPKYHLHYFQINRVFHDHPKIDLNVNSTLKINKIYEIEIL